MSIRTRLVFKLLALIACAAAGWSSTAQAVDNTRYISITGNDADACTLAAPCRYLPRGISSIPAGGELRILDSGDYGNSGTIRKSLTISGNGNTVFLRNALTVDDGDAVVTLRSLTLNGQGTIDNGISIVAAAVVHIERCVIHNFTQSGVNVTAEGVSVSVIDSVSRDNGREGLRFDAAGSLTVDNSQFNNNATNGVLILGQSSNAAIRRSIASGNGFSGIGGNGAVSVISTKAIQNGTGFEAQSGVMTVESSLGAGNVLGGLTVVGGTGAIARISNSTFTDNGMGIRNFGIAETRQNNTVRGNGIDLQGNALTPISGI